MRRRERKGEREQRQEDRHEEAKKQLRLVELSNATAKREAPSRCRRNTHKGKREGGFAVGRQREEQREDEVVVGGVGDGEEGKSRWTEVLFTACKTKAEVEPEGKAKEKQRERERERESTFGESKKSGENGREERNKKASNTIKRAKQTR